MVDLVYWVDLYNDSEILLADYFDSFYYIGGRLFIDPYPVLVDLELMTKKATEAGKFQLNQHNLA